MDRSLLTWTVPRVLDRYPFAADFFSAMNLAGLPHDQPVGHLLEKMEMEREETDESDGQNLADRFLMFIETLESLKSRHAARVGCVTVVGGRDKDGNPENLSLDLHAGEVIAVVGPTGSGKSLLLSDVECLAQGDSPSGRKILVDHRAPSDEQRLSGDHRLVAQLSQNMNFVMDVTVQDFLLLHAESRLVTQREKVVNRIYTLAVDLAGEPFGIQTPVTALSGGQSRALMIADVAYLSASPIVLIDEIENAGVDRRKALDLLVQKEKIVLMATHDPLLALSGDRRLVIRNGGIAAVLGTTPEEKEALIHLEAMDSRLSQVRQKIRNGHRIDAGGQPPFRG